MRSPVQGVMSPFADTLRSLRFRRGLRQQDLAELLDCDRSYLSALENDLKHPPSAAFVHELSSALSLSDEEAAALEGARARSRRHYVVPADTPMQTYEFVFQLFARLEGLSALQIQAMCAVLQLGAAPGSVSSVAADGRIRRSDRQIKVQEVPM